MLELSFRNVSHNFRIECSRLRMSSFVSVDIRYLINLHDFFIQKSDTYKWLLLKDLYWNSLNFIFLILHQFTRHLFLRHSVTDLLHRWKWIISKQKCFSVRSCFVNCVRIKTLYGLGVCKAHRLIHMHWYFQENACLSRRGGHDDGHRRF